MQRREQEQELRNQGALLAQFGHSGHSEQQAAHSGPHEWQPRRPAVEQLSGAALARMQQHKVHCCVQHLLEAGFQEQQAHAAAGEWWARPAGWEEGPWGLNL